MKTVEEYADQIERLNARHPRLDRAAVEMTLVEGVLDFGEPAEQVEAIRRIVAADALISERLRARRLFVSIEET